MSEYLIGVLALIVSALGLLLSFYVMSRNKPKLIVEKELLETKKNKNEIWIYFYLSNVGERPATIKKIDFYNPQTRFMPKTSVLEVKDQIILGVGEDLPTSPQVRKYAPIDFPAVLNSHSTIKILAKLDFTKKEQLTKETEREKLKYKARISYANKIMESLI